MLDGTAVMGDGQGAFTAMRDQHPDGWMPASAPAHPMRVPAPSSAAGPGRMPMHRIGASAHRRIGASAHRRIGASAHRRIGASAHRRIGASAHRE
ncbi:hypothetical protein [Streptomyces sp. XH2]|uniref:hypothetical protein n=1 Tax=Streptomyces sp. XH2 TaxID=3412483 RepID=UPI003C7D192E